MAAPSNDTELLTEHFGYPPVSLLDEIINSINFLAEKALNSVETGLLNAPPEQLGFGKPPSTHANSKSKRKRKQPPTEPEEDAAAAATPEEIEAQARAEIAAGTHQLETLLCTSIDRNFDRFELYVMRNILCVRPEDRDWIRLGHYEGLNFDNLPPSVLRGESNSIKNKQAGDDGGGDEMDVDEPPENPDFPTVDSVNRQRRRLQASQRLHTLLLAEQARNEALLGELRGLVGRVRGAKAVAATANDSSEDTQAQQQQPPLAFLLDRGDLTQADATTPLTTTTAFSLTQLQALRALSGSLSRIMPDVKKAEGAAAEGGEGGGGGSARRTWRKERVEYVEGAARRHLENVRGLELGRDGEVRDGEWQGEGRRFAAGEVGALERVVEMLGASAGDGKGDGEEGDGEKGGGPD